MPNIGDHVEVASRKGGSRTGEVVGVSGLLLTINWDNGEQTSLIAGPGTLSVIKGSPRSARAKKALSKAAAPSRPAPGKAAPSLAAPSSSAAGTVTTAKKLVPAKKTGSAKKTV